MKYKAKAKYKVVAKMKLVMNLHLISLHHVFAKPYTFTTMNRIRATAFDTDDLNLSIVSVIPSYC